MIIENDSKRDVLNKIVIIHLLNQSLHIEVPAGGFEIRYKCWIIHLNDNKTDTLLKESPPPLRAKSYFQLPEINMLKKSIQWLSESIAFKVKSV